MIEIVREMPHSEGHEKSVLSCLMKWPDLEAADQLQPDHFYLPARARLFERIQGQSVIDITTLAKDLAADGALDEMGGPAAIADIYTYAPNSAHFATHVLALHRLRARRAAIRAAQELTAKAFDETDDTFLDAAGEPMTRIFEIAEASRPPADMKANLRSVLGDYQRMVKGESSPMGIEVPSLPFWQFAFNGLHPKQVVVLSGFPTGGKTTLAKQICVDTAAGGHPTLFLSLEQPREAITKGMLAYAARVPGLAVFDPVKHAKNEGRDRPTKDEIGKIRQAAISMSEWPLYVEDPTSPRIGSILALLRRYHRKHGIKVAAIDYLQLIRGDSKEGSIEREISVISHQLQGIAKELAITIILLSQQNDEGRTKYASTIAEDADLILSIVQDRDPDSEEFGKHLYLFNRKDRHRGRTGDRYPYVLEKEMLRFVYDPTREYQP